MHPSTSAHLYDTEKYPVLLLSMNQRYEASMAMYMVSMVWVPRVNNPVPWYLKHRPHFQNIHYNL